VRPALVIAGAAGCAVFAAASWSALAHEQARNDRDFDPVVQSGAPAPGTATPTVAPRAVALAQPAAEWIVETATAAGIPEAAARAYGRATLNAPDGCGLGWTTLAAIGWVETHHGTIGGRTLGADGRPSSTVLGPALDGEGPVAAIGASAEGTRLHGNDRWEHAVGPMQFIPSSWQRWGADGDEDGHKDPHDLDDAALAAARYLCEGGGDLSTVDGWSAAVRSYNHSDAYVADVNAAALAYASR
jgi:membrane-bound lytic murein transglycosylase B